MKRASLVFAVLVLFPLSAWAEGSADIGPSQQLRPKTMMFIDLVQGDTMTWDGIGTLTIWHDDTWTDIAPGGDFVAQSDGTFAMRAHSQQVGDWDIAVAGAAPGMGRLSSQRWLFATGSYAQDKAASTSYFAWVPAGLGHSAVMELSIEGLSGNTYDVSANWTGIQGANGFSAPIGNAAFEPVYRLYLRPPEFATYSTDTLTAPSIGFSSGHCLAVEPGLDGNFSFDATGHENYRIVCDTDGDGVFNATSLTDTTISGRPGAGPNQVSWNGRTNGGDDAPTGWVFCRLEVSLGELHHGAYDVETLHPGLRMFELQADGTRVPLDMFWNDDAVQNAAVTMPGGDKGMARSGPQGVWSDDYSEHALTNVNARGWGDFSGAGKGNGALLNTYARMRHAESYLLPVEIVPFADCDGDGLSDHTERCLTNTPVCEPN